MLRPIYARTVNSLKRAERDAFNPRLGLFGGCSTFMESNSGYPGSYAMHGPMIAKTYALSTNLLYYRGYCVAAWAGAALGEDSRPLEQKAAALAKAVNDRLWMPDKGYYAYFLDAGGQLQRRMEGTGEAFAILYQVADAEKARQILRNTPVTAWGIPCLWPQYPEWKDYRKHFALYYHNGMIWPFVEGYWAWAASAMKDRACSPASSTPWCGCRRNPRPSWSSIVPKTENRTARRGSCGALPVFFPWSTTACAACSSRAGGIRFAPVVPATLQNLSLAGVKYRDCTLQIAVQGNGARSEDLQARRPAAGGSLRRRRTQGRALDRDRAGALTRAIP